jgi:hypothetical protein
MDVKAIFSCAASMVGIASKPTITAKRTNTLLLLACSGFMIPPKRYEID